MAVRFLPLLLPALAAVATASSGSPAAGGFEPVAEHLTLSGERSVTVYRLAPPEATGPLPTVILWHGGGWTEGRPQHLFPHAALLAEAGYNCLLPAYPLATTERGLAGCVDDAREMAQRLLASAKAWGIDPAEAYLLGESAGGHLAAMVALDAAPGTWAGLILLSPVVDLRSLAWLDDGLGPPPGRTALSPLDHLRKGLPPMLVLHGSEDDVVPPDQIEAWRNRAARLGLAARVHVLPDAGHAFSLPAAGAGETSLALTLDHLLAFLRAPKPDRVVDHPAAFEVLHAFDHDTGWQPFSGLSREETTAWGATHRGGPADQGVVFRVDLPGAAFETVAPLAGEMGRQPFAGFAFGPGAVWGVAKFGGPEGGGTLFKVDPASGQITPAAAFDPGGSAPAWGPHAGPILVEGSLWGTTFHGGASRWGGTLYRLPAQGGPIEILQSFDAATGEHPTGQLRSFEGWVYGTLSDYGKTAEGRYGSLFRLRPDGTRFEILHRLGGGGLGAHPYDRLVPHPDGFMLGTTFGAFDDPLDRGTLFAWHTATGRVETLVDFNLVPAAGGKPNGAPLVSVNGDELLLTTHGSLDPEHGFPGTALRLQLAAERVEHGFAACLRVTRIEVLHRFTGGPAGHTPMRTPVRWENHLFGVTAFGHAAEASVPDPTQTGGLVYRLRLPEAKPPATEPTTRSPLLLLPVLALFVLLGAGWLAWRTRKPGH